MRNSNFDLAEMFVHHYFVSLSAGKETVHQIKCILESYSS